MRILPKLALFFATIVLIAIVGEVLARLLAPSPPPRRVREAPPTDLPVLTDVFEISRKNVQGIYQGVFFRTNNHGVRGPDYSLEPDDGTFRILITGDSVTMGWAVEEELAFPRVLEDMLNQAATTLPGGHERYEVLNLGLAGANAQFANRRLTNLSEVYHPDLTIYAFNVNDIEGRRFRRGTGVEQDPESIAAWRRALRFNESPSYLLRAIWPRLMFAFDSDALVGRGGEGDPEQLDWYKNYFENPAAWADFVDALDRQAFQADVSGVCSHVFLLTHLRDLGPGHPFVPIYDRVAKAARQRGLTVSSSLSHHLSLDPKDLRVSPYDTHPNWRGHAVLAEALFEGLGSLPPECWEKPRRPAPLAP